MESGSSVSLRGLSALTSDVCWASGAAGTVLRTIDGSTWDRLSIPGAETLDFRDVQAFDPDRALVVSAGTPARIYLTENAGLTWELVYGHPDERAFFDAVAFWDEKRGMVFSDPIDGHLLVIATEDGGRTWRVLPKEALPSSPEGEAGFAASGTCLSVYGESSAWIGLGGTQGARVFRTEDAGASWEAVWTPMLAGTNSQGIFSLFAYQDGRGIAVGGDFTQPDGVEANAIRTEDGGVSWEPIEPLAPSGYRSSIVAVRGQERVLVATGPNGTDFSVDGGRQWARLSNEGYHVLACAADGTIWAAGSGGRIAKLLWSR